MSVEKMRTKVEKTEGHNIALHSMALFVAQASATGTRDPALQI
jgi:hypothetical protein